MTSILGRNYLLDEIQGEYPNEEALLIIFGGDFNLAEGHFSNDLWYLSLRSVMVQSNLQHRQRREIICRDLIEPSKTEYIFWEWTCGIYADVNSRHMCLWEDVLKMAWCLDQYPQNFHSPL
mmetsp:Transcript_13757/g.19673  ORF Transcript_13757/g.19673 Transcript_13757/m.19673 type:complete len:121 (+) Transcript_13757:49-411(+)